MDKLEKAMQKLKTGNKDDAFEEIYDITHKLVYYVIYRILKDPQETEGITQEVYMRLYQNIDKYESGNPRAYITTIARNLAINEYNKKMKTKVYYMDDVEKLADSKEYDDIPTIKLAKEILDEQEFLIVMLSTVQNYTRKALAKMFDLSTSGVTYKLNIALNKLKEALKEDD